MKSYTHFKNSPTTSPLSPQPHILTSSPLLNHHLILALRRAPAHRTVNPRLLFPYLLSRAFADAPVARTRPYTPVLSRRRRRRRQRIREVRAVTGARRVLRGFRGFVRGLTRVQLVFLGVLRFRGDRTKDRFNVAE